MGWKLVRDRNLEWCRAHGVSGQWRTAEDPLGAIRRKLFEEAGEYAECWEAGELYDLLDVIQAAIGRVPSGQRFDCGFPQDARELPETVTGLFGIIMAELTAYVTQIDPASLHAMRRAVDALISLQDPTGFHARAHRAKITEMGRFTRFIEWCPVPAGGPAQ
jgi:predicted house-cleaning noncanonical NTP pyrophosphatase (MazG superfamily)